MYLTLTKRLVLFMVNIVRLYKDGTLCYDTVIM